MPSRSAREIFEGYKWEQVGGEAMPSLASAALLFPNPPDDARFAILTIRTNGITVQFDGSDPTASDVGTDYAPGTYEFDFSLDKLKIIKAIQQAATATGYIAYMGLKWE
jgi:hypothetical protein